MAEELIIKCCAPTLAGLKPGSIFCLGSEPENRGGELKRCVDILKSKGLRVKGARGSGGQRLIYLYRPERVGRMVADSFNACLLRPLGYNTADCGKAVDYLMERIRRSRDFPHEIGLFLGYPAEDVKGYMENNGKNFKLCGMWKVYGNRAAAEKCFDSYRKCSRVYLRCFKNGAGLERLTVREYSSIQYAADNPKEIGRA